MSAFTPLRSPAADSQENRDAIEHFFKRLRFKLTLGLLLIFTIPYGALILIFDNQFKSILNDTGRLHLSSLAESQRKTVDLFLQERVINLFSLFFHPDFKPAMDQANMERLLGNLKQMNSTFVDLGFLNSSGRQVGYTGPYLSLRDKDYSGESWFVALMSGEKDYHVTDIYLGFRNKPHFTIAVKQLINHKPFIIRSTLDPDKFNSFLQTMSSTQGVESLLVNAQGVYQVVGTTAAKPFERSPYIPNMIGNNNVEEVETAEGSVLIAHSWLKETSWVLLVSQPTGMAHAQMHAKRNVISVLLVLIILAFASVIILTTSRLIDFALDATQKRHEMRLQLVHAAKLASIGELSAGIAHEINNPLAIIMATSGVIRDYFNPRFNLKWTTEDINRELDALTAAVHRAKGITGKLLDFGRKNTPRLEQCQINNLLDDIVNGLIEREFKVMDIEVQRRFDQAIPAISIDPDQISQVFLNLINNARDAIEGPGKITISTRQENGFVKVDITDTGKGMSIEQLKQIFNPFYTTKDVGKGTGLGLGISLNIVESMGGTIDVQSMEGKGSSFVVALPAETSDPEKGGR